MSEERSKIMFSTIMVCLNALDTIDDAITSVYEQACEDSELVVIDGGSTDGTVNRLEVWNLRFGSRMCLISEPDRGVYDAMNKGVSHARGQYLHFLNADDRYVNKDILLRVAAAAGSAVLIYGDVRFVDTNGGFVEVVKGGHRIMDFVFSRGPHHQGSFLCADAVKAAGGFRTDLGTAGDLALMTRLRARHAEGFTKISCVMVDFALGGISERPDACLRREMNRARAVGASLGLGAGLANFAYGVTLWARSWLRVALHRAGVLPQWRRCKARLFPGRYKMGRGE